MLTLDNWIKIGITGQSPNLIVLMEIEPTAAGVASDFFMSGVEQIADKDGSEFVDYVQNIHAITPVASSLDPISRQTPPTKMTVSLVDDGAVRDFVGDGTVIYIGAEVTLLWAHVDKPGTTAPLWKGVLRDIVPRDGFIEIRCADILLNLRGVVFAGTWWGEHPLELIKKLLLLVGTPTAKVDATSYLPATDTDISHYMVGDHIDVQDVDYWQSLIFDIGPPPPIEHDLSGMIRGLAAMMYGSNVVRETGIVEFKRFVAANAIVATWGEHDIISIEQQSSAETIINRVEFAIDQSPIFREERDYTGADPASTYAVDDTDSQTRYGLAVGDEAIRVYRLATVFTPAPLRVTADLGAAAVSVTLQGDGVGSIAGSRMDDLFTANSPAGAWSALNAGAWAQDADAVISAARPLYLLFNGELVKAETAVFSVASGRQILKQRYNGDGSITTKEEYLPMEVLLTNVTRGPTAQAFSVYDALNIAARDVTGPYNAARAILDRAANGLVILDVVTTVAQMAVQIGDFVAVEDTEPLLLLSDGLDSSNLIKWEVIRKEIDPLSSPPQIKWKLAFVSYASDPWTKTITDDPILPVHVPFIRGLWYEAAGGLSVTNTVWTIVGLDTISINPVLGTWSGTTYTLDRSGRFVVSAGVALDGIRGEEYAWIRIVVNGVVVKTGPKIYQGAATDVLDDLHLFVFHDFRSQANDVIQIEVFHTDATGTGNRTVVAGIDATFLNILQVEF